MPDVEKSSMIFEDMKVHGLAEFRIVKMHTDASAMEVELLVCFFLYIILKSQKIGNFFDAIVFLFFCFADITVSFFSFLADITQ